MIYEFRTYDLKPRSVPEFLERNRAKLSEGRLDYSDLGGFWSTEVGPLNQVIHIWPYEDLNQRRDVRAKVVADGVWPPGSAEFIVNMQSEIFNPAPFSPPLGKRKIGPLYELRLYTYAPGAITQVIDAWAGAIEARQKLSPLAGAWYSELGSLNRWAHMWAYESFEHRMRVRDEARAAGVWPPPSGVTPLRQENKLLFPADFSPMQ